jgi:hypothetical protein
MDGPTIYRIQSEITAAASLDELLLIGERLRGLAAQAPGDRHVVVLREQLALAHRLIAAPAEPDARADR